MYIQELTTKSVPKQKHSRAAELKHVIPPLKKPRQEHENFKASLDYKVSES